MTEDLFSSHPTLTPPETNEDRVSWLRLLRSRRVGISTFYRLMAEHGGANAALAALPEVARAASVQDYSVCPEGVVLAELKAARAAGAQMICYNDANYPTALADIPDPPPILWAIGDISLMSRPMVAMVGARNASSLGTRMARKLAEDLVEAGYVVVSGLARGIDTAAHLAALEGGTIAVQAGGVDVVYPKENAKLTDDIGKSGLRLSEIATGTQPQARHFPRRNRIISGLAKAVIIVEAAGRSGSLITAKDALDQGREVLAVPGHPFDARAFGCNALIRDGATLVRNVTDVIDAIGAEQPAPQPIP
jgi:DNA processing protein